MFTTRYSRKHCLYSQKGRKVVCLATGIFRVEELLKQLYMCVCMDIYTWFLTYMQKDYANMHACVQVPSQTVASDANQSEKEQVMTDLKEKLKKEEVQETLVAYTFCDTF